MKLIISTLLLLLISIQVQAVSKIDVSQIKGISIVYADVASGLESSFGHIGLRLHVSDKPGYFDISAEFVANLDSSDSNVEMYLRGIGFVAPFPVTIVYDAFENYRRKKSLEENRQLEIIELDLTDEQLNNFLKYLDDFQNGIISMDYKFLTTNCAAIPIQALEKILGRDIEWSNVPVWAMEQLRTLPEAKKSIIVKNASDMRVAAAKKHFIKKNYTRLFKNESWSENFLSDIQSPYFAQRQLSYLKLAWLRLNQLIPLDDSKRYKIYMSDGEMGEEERATRALLSSRNDTDKIILTYQTKVSKKTIQDTIKTKIVIRNNRPFAKLSFKYIRNKRINGEVVEVTRSKKYFIPLPELDFDPSRNTLYHEGKQIGTYVKTTNTEFLISGHAFVKTEILINQKGRGVANTFLFIDSDKNVKTNLRPAAEMRAMGRISILNSSKYGKGLGICNALIQLQKALTERAFFSTTRKNQLSSSKKINLLNELLAGNYIIVQGYENINDFTKSIDQDYLSEFLEILQEKHASDKTQIALDNFFKREELSQDNIKGIKAVLDSGHPLSMGFGWLYNDTKKLASTVGHVLYIYKMIENSDGTYDVLSYDPNTNIHQLYMLTKNLQLKYKDDMFNKKAIDNNIGLYGYVDILVENEIKSDIAVQSQFVRQAAIDKLDSMAISPSQIYTIMQE